ncbi:MAG: DNA gyrase C-terminal beta-propeller domain-containing protein, partial [Blastopirellula sp. JB062]
GRNSSGVKGLKLDVDDELVGMVVADPEAQLLTVCEHGYGKRTNFGPNQVRTDDSPATDDGVEPVGDEEAAAEEVVADEDELSSNAKYRTQRRGGKGLRDIKTTQRNGRVVSIVRVDDEDEVLMMTARGKIQRISAAEISIVGRNTQGVRIMSLDADDSLAAVVRVPKDEGVDEEIDPENAPPAPSSESDTSEATPSEDDSASQRQPPTEPNASGDE